MREIAVKKRTVHITKVISISVLSLLFLFQGFKVNARHLLLKDNMCTKSKVVFDTSSLRYIFSHAEEILLNPEEFWENDRAYKIIKKLLTYLKRPIPYDKWKKNISAMTALGQR